MEETNFWVQLFTSQVFLNALITIISAIAIYLGLKLKTWLNVKIGKDQLDKALEMAEIIASGVEQIAKQLGWDGEQKKKEATARLLAWSKKMGITYTDEEWSMLIERTVLIFTGFWDSLKNEKSPLPKEEDTPVELPTDVLTQP